MFFLKKPSLVIFISFLCSVKEDIKDFLHSNPQMKKYGEKKIRAKLTREKRRADYLNLKKEDKIGQNILSSGLPGRHRIKI